MKLWLIIMCLFMVSCADPAERQQIVLDAFGKTTEILYRTDARQSGVAEHFVIKTSDTILAVYVDGEGDINSTVTLYRIDEEE